MHWLPLVAMVIASALPFPHNPATAQPSEDRKQTSTSEVENQITYEPFSSPDVPAEEEEEEPLRTEEISQENSLPKDYKASRKDGDSDSMSRHFRTGAAEDSPAVDVGLGLEIDEMFLDAHPRVLFSPSPSPPEHPPLLLMLENGLMEDDSDGDIEGHGDRAADRTTPTPTWADYNREPVDEAYRPVKRDKRSHLIDTRRGEKSVCESESTWVNNKTTAIDSHGERVTIVPQIQTMTGALKQYFYETRCRRPDGQSGSSRTRGAGARSAAAGVAGASCLGVDKKQWRSECREKQSYVRALSKDAKNKMGWRWIRIDSSCVCVLLSRTNQGKDVMTRRRRV
ncbi:neurotrophin-4 [Poecilia reticulata]|uniref:Neurotrophin-4 n=1 Tax=Poecilia reticulata TaxID=8081 RepID=A0A3P9P447_POERE|nr:PREDICTED: neurotrophin-4-like [Poecilia reticulata]